ncbi:MAG: PDZ domain-containing protein [Planctomycetota bacterium]|nr:PDZ domain-containing protein [Planctomycetota bacterium]
MRIALLSMPLVLAAAVLAQDVEKTETKTPSADEWVQKLGHEDYAVREEATKKLIDMGAKAVPALERALKSDDLEVRLRAGRALRSIQGNGRSNKPEAEAGPDDEQRRDPARPMAPGSRSKSVQIQMLDGKVRVTIGKMVNGKEEKKTYEGTSLEELKKKHPEVRDALGGTTMQFRFGNRRDPFDMDDFWRGFNDNELRKEMKELEELMKRMRLNTLRGPWLRGRTQQATQGLLGATVTRPSRVLDAQLQLRGRGLIIETVEKGSRADKLGLEKYDVLMRLNERDIANVRDVQGVMAAADKTGAALTARVIRRGQTIKLKTEK